MYAAAEKGENSGSFTINYRNYSDLKRVLLFTQEIEHIGDAYNWLMYRAKESSDLVDIDIDIYIEDDCCVVSFKWEE